MSATMKEHATTMSPQEQELQLNQSIQHYQLEDWVAAFPGGFQTLRLFSDWKIALLIIKLMAMFFIFLKAYSELPPGDSGWFTMLTVAIVGLGAFALIFGLTRSVVFDLENDEVRVTLLGSTIFRKCLQGAIGFSYRYQGTLYLEFNDHRNIRIADISNEKELENLKRFILDALAIEADGFERQPDSPEKKEHLQIGPTSPALTLDVLRTAVRNDREDHPIKKLAELLIMALNDWPRESLDVEATIEDMKAWFGTPLTVANLKSPPLTFSMQYNSWRLEAGASVIEMIELSAKLENESDFDKIVARVLNYYGAA